MKVVQQWEDLVGSNPMLIEITRFRRKFLSFSGSNSVNIAVLSLVVICYLGLCLLVMSAKGSVPPIMLVIFQTCLYIIFAPALLHGAVAGERERRSWDLLLAAPVTKAQIVAGKFVGALAALGGATALFAVPILLAAVLHDETRWYDLFLAELVSVTFGIFVCGLTLLLSARVKRSMMALGASIGSLALVLLILPLLLATLLNGDRFMMEFLFYLHPVTTLVQLADNASGPVYPRAFYGWPHILIYIALAGTCVVWATKTLYFAENEVKFLPQKETDA